MLLALLLAAGLHDSTHYLEATALYRKVELEKALVLLGQALPDAASDAERAEVHAWIGLIEGQLGHLDRARAALAEAVRLDPNVQLPAPAPPEVTAILDEVRLAASPVEPPTPPATTRPVGLSPALGVTAGGVALVLVGGAVVGVGVDTVFRQAFEVEHQSDAVALRDLGYLEYAIGGALAAVGAAGLAVGAVMLATSE